MDGDVFSKVGREGRAAVDSLARAIEGGAWSSLNARRLADRLFTAGNQLPSLALVAAEMAQLAEAPLFADLGRESILSKLDSARHVAGATRLDMMLCRAAKSAVLRREFRMEAILNTFATQVLEQAIVYGRNGFLSVYGTSNLSKAIELLSPIASGMAMKLAARPEAKRLGMARGYPLVTANTNLLGA